VHCRVQQHGQAHPMAVVASVPHLTAALLQHLPAVTTTNKVT
jgi:hypothetical protein